MNSFDIATICTLSVFAIAFLYLIYIDFSEDGWLNVLKALIPKRYNK